MPSPVAQAARSLGHAITSDEIAGRAGDRDAVRGPINVVAPETVRNKAFSSALGRALRRPSWMPVPAFAVRTAAGEFADHVLHGRRAVPRALTDAGYQFAYPDVAGALAAIYRRK